MKKTILALAIIAGLASCGQGSGDAALRQKIVDSMNSEFSQGHIGARKHAPLTAGNALLQKLPVENNIASYIIPTDTATAYVHNWLNTLKKANMMNDTNCRAFIIPSCNLQWLTDSLGMNYVVFYLSVNSSNTISLLYEGGLGNTAQDSLTLYPAKYGATTGILDNTMPCPVCPITGLLSLSAATSVK